MRITSKIIEEQLNHVNQFALKDSIYRIRINRAYGYYNAYLYSEDRYLRLMYVGNAAEMNAFLTAFQMKYWYMNEPF